MFEDYIRTIAQKFSDKNTGEYGYRTDFENLLNILFKDLKNLRIANDQKAIDRKKPDFVVYTGEIPLLYFETKDVGTDLDKEEKSEQMKKYFGYANLILTDYLEFRFFRNGVKYCEPIKIGSYDNFRNIHPNEENFSKLTDTILDFYKSYKEPIKSGRHLSQIMGGKARRIRDDIRQFYSLEEDKNTDLIRLYDTLKKLLVRDLNLSTFSDMYAQTLVCGLFVARYYDESTDGFSRQKARELIPNSNPFLRHFFDHIVGADFDSRLKYIVDELCEVFSHVNVKELMKEYFRDDLWGETHKGPDPVIHFYEDFLQEYDPGLKKKMGAYYTPEPVVDFIVNSVDSILKTEFGLQNGLADTSKTDDGLHRVEILDPATGTGTFISKIIRKIYLFLKDKNQLGTWPAYVHHDLLPRIFGFELMMAPYTIAHLRLGIEFRKSGFWDFHRRLGIYLTNSLEENTAQQNLFSGIGLTESIAEESIEASKIKTEKPIMVVIGNPPYSVSSSNKGEWIQNLIKVYKEGLNERKINLDDDYIKFIRFAEHFIEKNGSGIVAMITNNSFIDGITHRHMRKHLLETFDQIYVLDLHGNSKKKETSPDGSKDENVFNIMQGVSISIFIKKQDTNKNMGRVYHADLYGKRKFKFDKLINNNLENIEWRALDSPSPYYFFVPKDFRVHAEYNKGFKISDFFINCNTGIQTKRDNLTIHFNQYELEKARNDVLNLPDVEIRKKYNLPSDGRDWTLESARLDLIGNNPQIQQIFYRPFDIRFTFYTGKTRGFLAYPRAETSKHIVNKDNLSLITLRLNGENEKFVALVANCLVEKGSLTSSNYSFLPLYLYQDNFTKTSNFNSEMINNIEDIIGKTAPEDIFDYIYAVLYSPNYREKYKEFLKIDFPRVPYPKDKKQFFELAKLGKELRELHLMESPKLNNLITSFKISGNNIVEKVEYKNGNVYINESQYFGDVPEIAWNFYIGGYQPVQKWLKDRKGRELTSDDIEHYQKIIVALVETKNLQKEIDKNIQV